MADEDEDDILGNSRIDSRKFLAANFITALIENSLFYPFEFLKTRQQALDIAATPSTPTKPVGSGPATAAASRVMAEVGRPVKLLAQQPSLMSQIRLTLRASGPLGFYRGFSWYGAANVPADIIYLYGYAMSKQTLLSTTFGKNYPTLAYMVSGAAGDFFSIVLVVPLEVVAQRLQIQDARIRMQHEAIA